MFEAAWTRVKDFGLELKNSFAPSESKIYVEDLRKAVAHNGRRCIYSKNYNDVVKEGIIQQAKDDTGGLIPDEYDLFYGPTDKNGEQPKFRLTLVKKDDNKAYFTISDLINYKQNHNYKEICEPFKFPQIDLKKYLSVFEVEELKSKETGESPTYKLTNSSVLNEEGRNGKLLYTSDYKPLNIHFSEIRDHNNNLELDKSLISVPIVFATALAKVCANFVTFLPMKLGGYLMSKQNPIAKAFGYCLFIPAAATKNVVNMGAVILRAPILLFVADERKYGDAYLKMWGYQFKECLDGIKSDYALTKNGTRPEEKEDLPERNIMGTWDELNAEKQKQKENGKEKDGKGSSESLLSTVNNHKSNNHTQKVLEERKKEGTNFTRNP